VLIAANSTLKLLKAYVQWEQIIGAAERIVKFVEANLQFEKRGNQILSIIQGGIRFEQVSFAYPNTNAGVHQVDLDINPGDFVALTGPNGSGKSTLVHLLLGFYSPDKGKIWLDGYEQSQSDLPSWRNQFAVVTRNPSIFSFSIKENIALGRVGVSFEEVRQAVQKVEMEDFILGLPDGYDTAVGEQGVRLSSGQRQRLALARVYIQDPPVIILDEAITSLDEHAERLLRDTLLSWVGKKTIIFISHNPISKWPINKTIVLKDGYIG
jgi:ABC-type bacteriocin/lantibiotic exporter with double-glycine peptidase domain